MQATGIGVVRDGRLGGEWFPTMDLLPILEQRRELGVLAGINWELGGNASIIDDFPLTYAMGCDHLTLFNIAEAMILKHLAEFPILWHRHTARHVHARPLVEALLALAERGLQSLQNLVGGGVEHGRSHALPLAS